jgi:hypothetical protein
VGAIGVRFLSRKVHIGPLSNKPGSPITESLVSALLSFRAEMNCSGFQSKSFTGNGTVAELSVRIRAKEAIQNHIPLRNIGRVPYYPVISITQYLLQFFLSSFSLALI